MATAKQDMPPSGGYRPINFGRIPAKTYFSGYTWFAGFAAFNGAVLAYYYMYCIPQIKKAEIEVRSSKLATLPMLLAEHDRAFLKQVRKNRDEEAKLMKNVPNWEVGTLYGEPIYKTLPEDAWIQPNIEEYYIHSKYSDFYKRAFHHIFLP